MIKLNKHFLIILIITILFISNLFRSVRAKSEEEASECTSLMIGPCHNRAKAQKLNYIAIGTILIFSMVGVSLPLICRVYPGFSPDKNIFLLIRAFASGVILATGFMHVMPDSWNDLTSPCLPHNPWRNFPFTPFIVMISAYATMMMDSFFTAYYQINNGDHNGDDESSRLLKDRVVAQVLELGIVVHSVVIGLSMGSSDNPCTIKPLITAICFHQLFEGMGLGGCILQAEYGMKVKAIMVFFFSVTTPIGIVLGIVLQKVYNENSPTALIVVGVLNAVSAGLLIYMALVDLLASDFKGPKLQNNLKLQFCCCVLAFMGTAIMSFLAKWA
ncbi:zinc transporter 7-like [Amaranthus tricolor]|uniref:zinc transporter 7-like n=1 Tax=Amaranthus tricolor TaxID=29722 RepID=UPI00258C8D60|nr:zinc transporter 7-like [Amaranthus tricolor]